jgi:acyl-CoA hydrolase
MSKGEQFIALFPSIARGGQSSRIVPLLPEGTVVTVPRNLADVVVTEYRIARLRGKA